MEAKLKKIAKKLANLVYYKKLSAAICDRGIPAIYIYPASTLPRQALIEISNAFKDEGLVPVFEEGGKALVVKWVPVNVELTKCHSVETKTSNLPEEILSEDNIQCVKFYEELTSKNIPSILLFLIPDCDACKALQKWVWEEQMDIKDESEAALLVEGINNLYEIQAAECPSFLKYFSITKYPVGILFYRGKVLDRCNGLEECKKKLKNWTFQISREVIKKGG